MKKQALTIAALALALSPLNALAIDDVTQSFEKQVTIEYSNDVEVDLSLDKEVEINKNIEIKGNITVDGEVSAVVDNKQVIDNNFVYNQETENRATLDGNSLQNAKGNIGANVAAGDYNAQDNAAAIAVGDRDFSAAEADITKLQEVFDNKAVNKGVTNAATFSGNALQNAQGNIGANVAAGNFNAQSNMLAITAAPASVGMAQVAIVQEASQNGTCNNPVRIFETQYMPIELSLKGTDHSTGQAYQMSNLYPDNWNFNPNFPTNKQHPNATQQVGHSDFDNETQGAVQNPGREGVGGFAFDTVSDSTMSGTITGRIPVQVLVVNKLTTNSAYLGGNALTNAQGNIGVNVAAGTGNLQANALAVSYVSRPSVGTPPTGGGESLR